ncbi:MAG: UDP-glucose 4-epimerase GalE [Deltaproteobacteria bacterium]|nr:MAG: UDP-glucose 4-epimerase GalE [Deltaproteobacteria bacterium]
MILVTGGAGYIGSHTLLSLADAGYESVTLDNLCYGHREAVLEGHFVQADLADNFALDRLFETFPIEAVIHFAAFCYVGESMEAPEKYFSNNLVNGLNLLNAMLKAGVEKIIFSSSCAVYGDPSVIPIPETHAKSPINPYGLTKHFYEEILSSYETAHGIKHVSLRYFNAAGADPKGRIGESHDPETHLIPLVLQAALGRRSEIEIFGTNYPTSDGTCIRDYIHVCDLAEAHVSALTYLLSGGQSISLNLGTGKGYSVREVFERCQKICQLSIPYRDVGPRPGDPPELVASGDKAREILDWNPRYSVDEIISTAWNWHQNQKF